MNDSTVNYIILLLVCLFIIYIVSNSTLKFKKESFYLIENEEKNNEPPSCQITTQEYNDLGTEWQNYLDSPTPSTMELGYATKMGNMTNKINQHMEVCFDNDGSVNKLSDGNCPDCQYAKDLFRHMDFNANHDLGFGSMASFCPNSLDSPGAQICLRNLKKSTTGIRQLSDEHTQQLVNTIAKENEILNKNISAIKTNVDDKLERDYVKSYLTYHKNYENAVNNYRIGEGTIDNVVTSMQPPQLQLNTTIMSDDKIIPFMNLFGDYQLDVIHARTMLLNKGIRETEINQTLLNTNINIGLKGINFMNELIPYGEIMEIPNTKSNEKAYRSEHEIKNIDIMPVDDNQIYLTINNDIYLLDKIN